MPALFSPAAAATAPRRAGAWAAMLALHLLLLAGLGRSLQPPQQGQAPEPEAIQWLWQASPPQPAATPGAAEPPAGPVARRPASPPSRTAPAPRPAPGGAAALQVPAAAALTPDASVTAPSGAAAAPAPPGGISPMAPTGPASAADATAPPALDLRLPRSGWTAPPAANPALQAAEADRRGTLTLEQRLDLALGGSGPWTEEVIDADHRRLRRGNTCVTLQRSRLAQIDPFSAAARNLPWQVGTPTRCAGP